MICLDTNTQAMKIYDKLKEYENKKEVSQGKKKNAMFMLATFLALVGIQFSYKISQSLQHQKVYFSFSKFTEMRKRK